MTDTPNTISKSPEGWSRLPIKEVVTKPSLTGKKLKQKEYQEKGSLPVIDQGEQYIGGYTDKQDMKIECELPVIIFGDHTRHFKYIDFDFVAGADGVKVLMPSKAFYPKLFYYFLKGIRLPNRGYSRHYQFLEKSYVPIPPYNEQKRIVAKIEELFTMLDTGIEGLKKAKMQIKRYRQSVLEYAFSGKLTERWREDNKDRLSSVEDLFSAIQDERKRFGHEKTFGRSRRNKLSLKDAINRYLTGERHKLPEGWTSTGSDFLINYVTSGSRGWAKYYSDDGALFIRMGNLDHDSILLDLNSSNIQRVTLPKTIEGKRTRVLEGDILVSITADVGMIALIPKDFEEAYINQHIALVRPVSLINKKYFAWFLASRDGGQLQFQRLQRGATKVGLGLDDMRFINVPVPCIEEQAEVIRAIEHHFSIADKAEQAIDLSLKQAERLRQSILKRAFEGRLVPQNPNDEPAIVLLERIKAEKEKLDKKSKTTRKRRAS